MIETIEEAPLCLPFRHVAETVSARLPEGSCDAHFHVFEPGAPLISPRSYTPRQAPISAWKQMALALGIARGVLVQPSVYGTDNGVLLNALRSDPDSLRGVVVVSPDVTGVELDSMHAAGVRGIRINLRNPGGQGLESVPVLAERLKALGWHIQIQAGSEHFASIAKLAGGFGVTCVVDHAGFCDLTDGGRTAVQQLQRLMDSGNVFVKLSAPYRLARPPAYVGFAEVCHALAQSHPDRILWASDWPHTELFDEVPEDTALAANYLDWFEDDGLRHRFFVSNAAALYWA